MKKENYILSCASLLIFALGTASLAAAENKPADSKTNSDKPDEESMFGSDQEGMAAPENKSNNKSIEEKTKNILDNALQVGGIVYYRLIASPENNVKANLTPISMPLQMDGFIDARPNDRIRVFIDARLLYDATRDQYSKTTRGTSLGGTQASSSASVSTATTSVPNNPQVVLDQAWLKFDIGRAVFITGGNQHVKWGTSRFWNPTDFINTQKRDPLLPYDLRLGVPMVRFDVPLQFISSNFTAISFYNQPVPASTAGQLGAALRFETLIGNSEIGIDAVYKSPQTFSYGLDFSAPLGPFDIYAEAAYLTKMQSQQYTLTGTPTQGQDLSTFFTTKDFKTPIFQVSGGINFSFAWLENRQATLGAEYFYNQSGYTGASIYPILIFNNEYQPFYLGQHYAAVYLTVEGPDSGKHTSYTLSVIGNLSDKSLISRLDFSWNFLTYLTFEMFVDGRFGSKGGEFNFSLDTPQLTYKGGYIPAISIPETIFDVGLALRTRF